MLRDKKKHSRINFSSYPINEISFDPERRENLLKRFFCNRYLVNELKYYKRKLHLIKVEKQTVHFYYQINIIADMIKWLDYKTQKIIILYMNFKIVNVQTDLEYDYKENPNSQKCYPRSGYTIIINIINITCLLAREERHDRDGLQNKKLQSRFIVRQRESRVIWTPFIIGSHQEWQRRRHEIVWYMRIYSFPILFCFNFKKLIKDIISA